MVRIGHASVSEKGTVNGAKGDSTKKEVCTRTWYNGTWDFVAIHPDANVREKHAQSVEAACSNDKVGYGQSDRNTLNTEAKAVDYNIAKITKACNCDCSSLMNVCAVASGAKKATYGSNGWTTRNMRTKLQAAGYVLIEDKAYLTSSTYCVRGAIYVREGYHTVCGLDNGSKSTQTLKKAGVYSAPSTSATTTATSNIKVGDTVKIKSGSTYYNGTKLVPAWVLAKQWIVKSVNKDRIVIDKSTDGKSSICSAVNAKNLTVVKSTKLKSVTEIAKEVINGKWGNGDARKKALTEAGYDYATVQKKVNELL